jgi:hypothetical protein
MRQSRFPGQRHQVCGRQVSKRILDFVQVLNEQVASPGFVTQQVLHLCQCSGLYSASARLCSCLFSLAFGRAD